tara:strand:+ start:82 stop:618 length:537 start_codon:yes stop_codon:yes gene_type:complete
MPIKYKDVFGHFNFEQVYQDEVNKALDGDQFLEIGCYLGRSTIYLAELIKESGKNIKLHVIDTFKGEGNTKDEEMFLDKFNKNVETAGVEDVIITHIGTSDELCEKFEDKQLDFIYVDGLHTYDGVKADIKNYLPKIKKGKIFAGHDYQFEPVRTAVNESLGAENLTFYQNTWKFYVS